MKQSLADLFFPPFCVSCSENGSWWCEDCRRRVHLVQRDICPRCLAAEAHECVGEYTFTKIVTAGFYHDERLRKVITALKFNGAYAILPQVVEFLRSRVKMPDISSNAVLIPIPLAEKRLKERGFNQAELIAGAYREAFNLQNEIRSDVLMRSRFTDPQSSLEHSIHLRQQNIAGCFQCSPNPPEEIVLADDVATTGATAAEAAGVLLTAGAQKVWLLTLAIGR
ncbi:MAG: ComF family protein [Patescibacteria group bacterium]